MALDRVVFLHIPHTAGTYFKQTLRCWGCACATRASRERDFAGCARVRASTFGPVERRRLHAAGAAGCVDQLVRFSAPPKRLVELHHFDLSFARLLEGRGFSVATIARHPLEVWLSHFGRQRPRAAPLAVAPDEFEAFVARSFGGRLGLFHDSALMWWSGCDLRRAARRCGAVGLALVAAAWRARRAPRWCATTSPPSSPPTAWPTSARRSARQRGGRRTTPRRRRRASRRRRRRQRRARSRACAAQRKALRFRRVGRRDGPALPLRPRRERQRARRAAAATAAADGASPAERRPEGRRSREVE